MGSVVGNICADVHFNNIPSLEYSFILGEYITFVILTNWTSQMLSLTFGSDAASDARDATRTNRAVHNSTMFGIMVLNYLTCLTLNVA